MRYIFDTVMMARLHICKRWFTPILIILLLYHHSIAQTAVRQRTSINEGWRNSGDFTINQRIIMQDTSITEVVPYLTTELKNAEQGAKITATNNSFSYILPSKSVVTFVEQ